ncbi:MAG: hypothetical protein ABIL68_12650 [bacterium]
MYHLTEKEDRLTALDEAHRVLMKGGFLLAVIISRFASALDGLFEGFLDDPQFARIVERDLIDGQHRNPRDNLFYWMTAYFHRPEELKTEVEEAGLRHEMTLAIDGPGWLLQNFEGHWNDEGRRARLLDVIRKTENEPSMLGVSAHVMGVARKNS